MHPQPVHRAALQENVDQAGEIDEVFQRQLFGPGRDPGQKGAEIGSEFAVVAKIAGMVPDRHGIALRAAVGLIPMGDEPYDFTADFRLGHCAKHILGGHRADDTRKPPRAQ